MGAFLLGLIIGFGGAVAIFVYNEGELFLKLGHRIKDVSTRYKHQAS